MSGRPGPARNRSIGRMRVLVAPDKFRGTLTARQAAEAVATGWRRTRPDDRLDLAPMADGGEGTMAALVDALHGEVVRVTVSGPREDQVEAAFGIAEAAEGRVAIVEMASASGLELLSAPRRDPRVTTTRGTGELIAAALDREPVRLIVGLGGSATNDAGAGMAQALGVRLLDEQGREVAAGGLALAGLARIDATADRSATARADVRGRDRRGQPAHRSGRRERGLRAAEGGVRRRRGRARSRARAPGRRRRARHRRRSARRARRRRRGRVGVRPDGVPGRARPAGGRRGGRRARAARADGRRGSDDHGGGEARRRVAARQGPGRDPRARS